MTQNLAQAVPAPSPDESAGRKVTVFPNPYKVEAQWDAGRLVRDHYLWFANLPERCTIRIYTLSGDLVKNIDFDGATYDGSSARGLYDPSSEAAIGRPAALGLPVRLGHDHRAGPGGRVRPLPVLGQGRRDAANCSVASSSS